MKCPHVHKDAPSHSICDECYWEGGHDTLIDIMELKKEIEYCREMGELLEGVTYP